MGDHRLEEWRSFLSQHYFLCFCYLSCSILIFLITHKNCFYSSFLLRIQTETVDIITAQQSTLSAVHLIPHYPRHNTIVSPLFQEPDSADDGPWLARQAEQTAHQPHLEIPHIISHFKNIQLLIHGVGFWSHSLAWHCISRLVWNVSSSFSSELKMADRQTDRGHFLLSCFAKREC